MAPPNLAQGRRGAGMQPVEQEAREPLVTDRNQRAKIEDDIDVLVARLAGRADDRVGQRRLLEDRWILDLRQYHGLYDSKTMTELEAAKKSRLYVNMTRPKTNAWEARLSDMLFPTDDKNWAIEATPVPELIDKIEAAPLPEDGQQEDPEIAQAKAAVEEAKRRAQRMEREVEDQLVECRYAAQCRDQIHDGTVLGTGIIKGPVASEKTRRAWALVKGSEDYVLVDVPDDRPAAHHVNIWGFFPDMSARTIEESESEGFFEMHLMTPGDLRKLATKPGFMREQIEEVLEEKAPEGVPHWFSTLREVAGGQHDGDDRRYQVWEYRGPLTHDDLKGLCLCFDDAGLLETIEGDELGALDELQVVVWFCNNRPLKFGLHHLDSGETVYSAFCFEKDETSIFGYGVPYLMRDSQRATNAAWRMMMDNAALSSGPQIEVNTDVVEPADGDWEIRGRKVWKRKKGMGSEPGIVSYTIESRQGDLAGIIEIAEKFIDTEVSLPLIAQGDQAAHITQTQGGMAMLMNSVNVIFRRVVKNFDDDVTTPIIRRFYDWNMQFSAKKDIKGDFEVNARGSSVLLVRDMQAQNLMVLLFQATQNPALAELTRVPDTYRKLVQAHSLPADEIVKSDEDLREEAARREQEGPQDPELIKLQFAAEEAERERQHKERMQERELASKEAVALMQRDAALTKLATEANISLDKAAAQLTAAREALESKERVFAAEAAMEERKDARGDMSGSGGYV